MSEKNPYLLTAAQIRLWAARHNEEAWLVLLKMLEGQNTFFMEKRGKETAQLIERLQERLATGGIPEESAAQLRKVLTEITSVAGKVKKEHKHQEQKLSGLSGSAKRLERKLEKLRKLQAKRLDLDSKLVKGMQQAKDIARKREMEAQQKADLLIAKAVAKAKSAN